MSVCFTNSHQSFYPQQPRNETHLPARPNESRESKPREAASSKRTDEELVRLAQAGDTAAFGELVERHLPLCLSRAFLLLRNRTDAEDEVQNAFSKAFECLEQFRFEGPFAAWLCRTVQNQCLMLIRSRRQVGFLSVDGTSVSHARLELVDRFADQEEMLGIQQVDHLLRREISRIPPLMRNVIVLRDVEGLPMAEVAARLGVSVPAAKSRLMRARTEMRSRLSKYCGARGPRTLSEKPARRSAEYTYVKASYLNS